MALLYLRTLNPHLSLCSTTNPNPNLTPPRNPKNSIHFPLFSSSSSPTRCLASAAAGEERRTARPGSIPWNRDLSNSVRLIGTVGTEVQMKQLTTGKAVAGTRLGIWKSATETTWVNLTFWDELAHTAFEHIEKGQRVFVSGRLVSDVVDRDDERQVYYKVVVQQLNFVESSYSPEVSLYSGERNRSNSGERVGDHFGSSSDSTEELWQAFFANPLDWWDNRTNKRNPKYPDFKHKHTGEALWVEGRYNPSWVKSQLAILDSRMSSLQDGGTKPAVSVMYADELTPF